MGRRGPWVESRRRVCSFLRDLNVIHIAADMSTAGSGRLTDTPKRTWRRWQAKAKQEIQAWWIAFGEFTGQLGA